MAITQEQYNRLIKYLNSSLTPEEETDFMKELNENTDLQREFDFELILRESLNPDATTKESENNPEFESAATHLEKAKVMLQHPHEPIKGANDAAKVVPFKPDYKKIISIAALFLIIAGFLIFYFKNKHEKILAHTKHPTEKDSTIQQKDSAAIQQQLHMDNTNNPVALADNSTAQEALKKYYSRYKGSEEDPGQVRRYLNAYYYDKNYTEVLEATEADYQTKGAGDSLSNSYVAFYKALCWIETGKPDKGIVQLKKLLKQGHTDLSLFHSIQWYLAMAYLKNNDVAGAKKTLQVIAASKNRSPYKAKAGQLLKALG